MKNYLLGLYEKSMPNDLTWAEKLQAAKRSVERAMKKLRESGRIVREGGKRYGRWKILQ